MCNNMKYILLFLMVGSGNSIVAQKLGIESFRPILTLTEIVHEGIVEVQSDLEQDENLNVDILIQKIDGLNSLLNNRGNYRPDVIRSEDKEHLQNMIDKIDQLINALERGSKHRSIDLLKEGCDQLKNNLD